MKNRKPKFETNVSRSIFNKAVKGVTIKYNRTLNVVVDLLMILFSKQYEALSNSIYVHFEFQIHYKHCVKKGIN